MLRLSDIIKHTKKFFEKKRKNPIQLENDSNLESNLKFLKVSDKSTPLQISDDTINVQGSLTVNGTSVSTEPDDDTQPTITALNSATENELVTVGATTTELDAEANLTFDGDHLSIAATGKIFFDGGTDTYIHEASADKIEFAVGGDDMLILDETNDKITMGATNWVAGTVSGATVTEFSSANSAYAGMILGCVIIGANVADDSYTLTTSYVCFQDSGGTGIRLSFKTPPSENVEIEVELYFSAGSGASDLELSLSNNATYASNSLTNPEQFEKSVREPARGHSGTVTQKWYIGDGNISAIGSINHIYIAAKCDSTTGTPIIGWGGDATGEHTNLVLKATALPETIAVGS